MTEKHLGPIVSGEEIGTELRRRRRKEVQKTVSGSSRKHTDQKAKLEEADDWRTVRKNAKSTRMAKAKPADEQLEDEVWSMLAQMGFKEMSKGRQFTVALRDDLATPSDRCIREGRRDRDGRRVAPSERRGRSLMRSGQRGPTS